MNSLRLSPLPSIRAESDSESRRFEREGFVDEAVVAAMTCQPRMGVRRMADPGDLVLAADDLDFAGWQVPAAAPWQTFAENAPLEIPVRRPAPPVLSEAGLGVPHSGAHRWWLVGLAGVLSTMLFSLLLLTLAMRQGIHSEALLPPHADSAPPVPMNVSQAKSALDLAETSAVKPQSHRGD